MREAQINLYNTDCMEGMKEFPDNYFHLAIVDPPYGIGDFWKGGDTTAQHKINKLRKKEKSWNNETPKQSYWLELRRVSKNQIIWGWNYYTEFLGNSNSLIYWHKKMGAPNYSDGELAFTTFKHNIKTFVYPLAKDNKNRTHPCQKPIALYIWLLENYTKSNKERILDTHLGSGSIAIAADKLGFDLWGYELDKDYYEGAVNRLSEHRKQLRLF